MFYLFEKFFYAMLSCCVYVFVHFLTSPYHFTGAALSESAHQGPGRVCEIHQTGAGPVRIGV